jgi:outer membrane receptor protein involved in Fe transport
MKRKYMAALAISCAIAAHGNAAPNDATTTNNTTDTGSASAASVGNAVETIEVTAQRLNDKRAGIGTQTGASTYTIDEAAIDATPGGDNTLLNQVILQAPDVVQDSFGQFHVRGDHNDLQYRLNGIVLPEGINVFGQSLSPRPISTLQLITGALPAQYGLRTAGVIDITTKSGLVDPGGSISVYGGSHGTFEPSVVYGGSSDNLNYFVTGDYVSSNMGIESPDRSTDPLHDDTTQYHGFGYFEDILDPDNRLSLIVGTSNGKFQIPNQSGLQPSLGLTVLGQTEFPSQALDENQRELTNFAIVSWQHSQGALDWQSSLSTRYSRLAFTPSPLGDLLYDGIAQNAYKRDVALGWQTDAAYQLNDAHTLRAGWYVQHDDARTQATSLVLPTDDAGNQTSDVPISISDNGSQSQWIESVYLQDEWNAAASLTVNYGLRFDHYDGFSNGDQVSPRLNAVWVATPDTTVHAGYSRYFTPPPFELVGSETISRFANTTAAPEVTLDTPPKAERADYYDVGLQQQLFDALTVGVDGYYRHSLHLIDEGQFGAPIILTPFNYNDGQIEGIEFTANYQSNAFSMYGNLAFQSADGRAIESAQFNFAQDDLNYIATHHIHLDHEQRVTASAGTSYLWNQTRFSADMLYGTGLRSDLTLADGSSVPNGAHLPSYTQVNVGISRDFHLTDAGALTARLDVINVFDHVYEIRDGTGVGVGAPQYGPRRGIFFGVSQDL